MKNKIIKGILSVLFFVASVFCIILIQNDFICAISYAVCLSMFMALTGDILSKKDA